MLPGDQARVLVCTYSSCVAALKSVDIGMFVWQVCQSASTCWHALVCYQVTELGSIKMFWYLLMAFVSQWPSLVDMSWHVCMTGVLRVLAPVDMPRYVTRWLSWGLAIWLGVFPWQVCCSRAQWCPTLFSTTDKTLIELCTFTPISLTLTNFKLGQIGKVQLAGKVEYFSFCMRAHLS